MKEIKKEVSPRFEEFLFDWYYKYYFCLGGYGSGKSYHIALKLILKCFEEKRKVLVVREVYETIKDSCYDLFAEILSDMDLLAEDESSYRAAKELGKVYPLKSPMEFKFPNGSRIIFKGITSGDIKEECTDYFDLDKDYEEIKNKFIRINHINFTSIQFIILLY